MIRKKLSKINLGLNTVYNIKWFRNINTLKTVKETRSTVKCIRKCNKRTPYLCASCIYYCCATSVWSADNVWLTLSLPSIIVLFEFLLPFASVLPLHVLSFSLFISALVLHPSLYWATFVCFCFLKSLNIVLLFFLFVSLLLLTYRSVDNCTFHWRIATAHASGVNKNTLYIRTKTRVAPMSML